VSYAFVHEGKAYGPSGSIKDVEGTPLEAKDADGYNKALEAQEIEWLKTGPERLFLYISREEPKDGFTGMWTVTTWLGTKLAYAAMGSKVQVGFGMHTYRRAMSATIFGVLYHGWFYESSGDYCRLKRAKRQPAKGGLR
jgi:hypothetical protein